MVRVLIVDNSFDLIFQLKGYIKKSSASVRFVYTVNNPNDDIQKIIEKNSITTMFLNVSFYGVNTLNIVRELKIKAPELKIVYVGMPEDVEYIKKYMEFNGVHYILRPIKLRDVSKTIEFIDTLIQRSIKDKEENNKLMELAIKNQVLFEQKFLDGIIKGRVTNRNEIIEALEYFDINLDLGFRVFSVRIDHYKSLILALEEVEKHTLAFKIKKVIDEIFGEFKHITFFSTLNEVVIITNYLVELNNALDIAEIVKDTILKEIDIRTTIGIGRYYNQPEEIYISYNEAVTALQYRFYFGYNKVIPVEYVAPNNIVANRIQEEDRMKLIYIAVVGESEYCSKQIDKIFDILANIENVPEAYYCKYVQSIFVDVDALATSQAIDTKEFYDKYIDYEYIKTISTVDGAKKYVKEILLKFCEYMVSIREEDEKELFEKSKHYLEQNINENFNMNKMSMELSTTSDHMDNAFIKFTGETTFDYLQRMRLEACKRYLRETSFDDEVIAIRSGYETVGHFRSIFKKYEGKTPEDYRNKYNVKSAIKVNLNR